MRVELTLTCSDPDCTKQRGAVAQTAELAFARLVGEAIEWGWCMYSTLDVDRSDYCPDHNPERKRKL